MGVVACLGRLARGASFLSLCRTAEGALSPLTASRPATRTAVIRIASHHITSHRGGLTACI